MEQVNFNFNFPDEKLRNVVLILSLPFLYCYFMFFAFHTQITNCNRPSDEAIIKIIDPHTTLVPEHDGIEPNVLFALLLFIGPAGFLLFQSSLPKKILAAISVVLWLLFFVEVRFFQNFFSQLISDGVLMQWIKILGILTITVFLLRWLYKKVPLLAQLLIVELTLLVCFIPYSDISYFDYSFLLAPALKLVQGAKISESYFQYDLLPSIPAMFILKNDWSVYVYRYVIQAGTFVFVISAFITARKFFLHKSLAFYFFVLLLIVRLFMGITEISIIPQATPIRLDWWLLLIGCACFSKNGIADIKFGICLLLLVVLVNSFGFIYFVCYTILVLFLFCLQVYTNCVNKVSVSALTLIKEWLRKYGLNISLGVAGIVLYYFLTGHFVNESITLYGGYQIGMLPVKQVSIYWYYAAVFAVCFGLLLLFRNKFTEQYFNTSLLLLALCAGCSIYFFGRSHENNVINISGILLFVVLLCCDVLLKIASEENTETQRLKKIFSLTPLWLIIIVMTVNNSALFTYNFTNFRTALASGVWSYPESQPESGALESISTLAKGSKKLYFMTFGATDFYFYYRGHYNMPAKFNPIDSWILLQDKIEFANKKLEEGYYVVGVEADYLFKSDILSKLRYKEYFTNGRYLVIHE